MFKKLVVWFKSFGARRRERALLSEMGISLPTAAPAPGRASAHELLRRLESCSTERDGWTEIWEKVDPPSFGKAFNESFLLIRGPHMMVPHAGINVMIEGARAALARDPSATGEEALRLALLSANPFTRQSTYS